MKTKTYYSIRSNGVSEKATFSTEEEAFESAKSWCLSNGGDVSVILHEGDISRLVKKVYTRR